MNISGKTIVAVFAHPDDETFGPGATLHKLAQNNEVYIVCATCGEAGQNGSHETKREIAEIRREELQNACKILGVQEVIFLGFEDGTLSNNQYHAIADAVKEKLTELQPDIVMTFEPKGVSGHIDHMAISAISAYVARDLPSVQEVWYYGNIIEKSASRRDYFIYFPPGYDRSEFDEIVDISDVWDVKVKAMEQHHSQIKDMHNILESAKNFPKEEYFFIVKREDL